MPEVRQAGRTSALGFGQSRLQRRDKRIQDKRTMRVHDAKWVDKYPWVMGTLPEKLVFNWLADHGVPFTFQASLPDYPGTTTVENFRPDFYLERFKIVIEVQGEYWHSLPDQAEHDVYKFAVYELMGLKCYWWWESDILENLAGLIAGVPELTFWAGPKEGWTWENRIDDLAGLRSINASRRMPSSPTLKR